MVKTLLLFLALPLFASHDGFPFQHSPGPISNWAWVNQNGATTDTTGGVILITVSSSGVNGNNVVILKKPAPATPWQVITTVGVLLPNNDPTSLPWAWEGLIGPVFRQSLDGKMTTCQWDNDKDGWFYAATRWSSVTAGVMDVNTDYYHRAGHQTLAMFKAGDDGMNRYCEITMDRGAHWLRYYQESRTTYMTADEIGIAMNLEEGMHVSVFHYLIASWFGV